MNCTFSILDAWCMQELHVLCIFMCFECFPCTLSPWNWYQSMFDHSSTHIDPITQNCQTCRWQKTFSSHESHLLSSFAKHLHFDFSFIHFSWTWDQNSAIYQMYFGLPLLSHGQGAWMWSCKVVISTHCKKANSPWVRSPQGKVATLQLTI